MKNPLIVSISVEKPIDEVWKHWTEENSIKIWNIPFDDWHCPKAENNLRDGGEFRYRMERIDGKEGFDYTGIYSKIIPLKSIESICDDGRKNLVEFQSLGDSVIIRETFEPEDRTPLDIQQNFTDSVLKRFKKFIEN
ncbi:SRPBCC domain-containing protein [Chryseobacterium sp. MIQD13]|uniref:SRPBCC domain-containing protein n=1 Tax=Chryseobacterium sp. MIQD13 TaxID=3422310 RepID=UPI003D29F73C